MSFKACICTIWRFLRYPYERYKEKNEDPSSENFFLDVNFLLPASLVICLVVGQAFLGGLLYGFAIWFVVLFIMF
jgi:hypothetical protein